MYGAYLSHAQLKDYLAVLLKNELLEAKGMKYQTTRKGLDFLKQYERIGSMMEVQRIKSE